MPGHIEKRGDKWVTTWGDKEFKHDSKKKAEAQLRLLYAQTDETFVAKSMLSTPNATMDLKYASQDAGWRCLEDVLQLHQELHRQFGDDPTDEAIEAEQAFVVRMRSNGIEHRHTDALAKKSGTIVDSPVAPTVAEAMMYLSKGITLDGTAVELLQDVNGGSIYLEFSPSVPSVLVDPLRRALNRGLPPGLSLKPLPKNAPGTFAAVTAAFSLGLTQNWFITPVITMWEIVSERYRVVASEASAVFKADEDPRIPFRVVKSKEAQRKLDKGLVTGVVLEPGIIDKTTMNPDGTPTGAIGDTYDAIEIEKAMHWWMEFASHQQTFLHQVHGGKVLKQDQAFGPADVVLIENFIARTDYDEGDQHITKGTWMATELVKNKDLKEAIEAGEVDGWSIGASALGALEDLEDDEPEASEAGASKASA
jgi:hypothetical protein